MRLVLCVFVVLLSTVAHGGTFYNPKGDPGIQTRGAKAAAALNEALSSLHLMYAALELKDDGAFQKHRKAAMESLSLASSQFRSIHEVMPASPLKLNPKTDAEKEAIDNLFKYTLPKYKVSSPKTERDLVQVAVVVSEALRSRLEKGDIKPGSDDWRPVREVIRLQLDLAGAGLAVSLIFSLEK